MTHNSNNGTIAEEQNSEMVSASEAFTLLCGGTPKKRNEEKHSFSSQKTTPQTPLMQFPYCPVRIGRFYDDGEESKSESPNMETVVTCGYRKVTVAECVKCNFQRTLNENRLGNDLKVFKNSRDVEKLKVELAAARQEIKSLREMVEYLISIYSGEGYARPTRTRVPERKVIA